MEIRVDEMNRRAIIELEYKDYFLIKTENEEFPYGLAYRIDMSYKGKPDQWSQEVILFGEEEYKKLKGVFDEVI